MKICFDFSVTRLLRPGMCCFVLVFVFVVFLFCLVLFWFAAFAVLTGGKFILGGYFEFA